MTKQKSLKRALLSSVFSLLVCFTMLLGTTFAWFTDSVTSGTNRIVAGTLKIDLELLNEEGTYSSVKEMNEPIFSYDKWEPGYTEVKTLKIQNEGTLALKYQMDVVAENANCPLANVIDVYMCFGESNTYFTESNWWYCGTLAEMMANPNGFTQGKLLPVGAEYDGALLGENGVAIGEITATIALHMQETAGNEYQDLDLGNIDVKLLATQYDFEKDSYGKNYDTGVFYGVSTANDVNEMLKEGKTVSFASDITAPLSLSAIYGTPVAIQQKNGGTINGNGKSLDIENPQYNGYAIETWGGTIKNLKIDSPVGRGIIISSPTANVYIDNVTIDGPGYAINTTEHNGKALVVTNSTVNGWTSLAGLNSVSFTKCSFGENSYKYWQEEFGYDQDYDRLVKPYVSSTFKACTFSQGFYVDLSALGAGYTITLEDCVVGGVELTAANYANYITIELPSGRTVADCVIFK